MEERRTVLVRAESFQYYLYDDSASPEWGQAVERHDGVVGLVPGGVLISSGVQGGDVQVDWALLDRGPSAAPTGVAAECDLAVDSGVLVLATAWEKVIQHDFGSAALFRIRVSVSGRDAAFDANYSRSSSSRQPERHRVEVWPSHQPGQRWRSPTNDRVGWMMKSH